MNYLKYFLIITLCFLNSNKILIPMDLNQTDHLKAYGFAFWALNQNINVEWLLNYRGGSFLLDEFSEITEVARVRGVTYETVDSEQALNIFNEINLNNMEIVLLEKAPKIAIYSPPNKQPWDDAVTLALTYAEVPYDVLWDKEVFNNLKYSVISFFVTFSHSNLFFFSK